MQNMAGSAKYCSAYWEPQVSRGRLPKEPGTIFRRSGKTKYSAFAVAVQYSSPHPHRAPFLFPTPPRPPAFSNFQLGSLQIEAADYLGGILTLQSAAGGTGSGFGAAVMEALRDELPSTLFLNHSVW